MKNAILYCPSKNGIDKNIGDFIQGIAANQFMDADYLVDRESMNVYDGDPIKVIMNGWFMHRPENFPPNDKIHPLYISFHINPVAAKTMLTKSGIDHLKRFAPIGCRDLGTVRLLNNVGVDAYFTGCLTLTLGDTYRCDQRDSNGHGVCFVDVPFPDMLPMRKIILNVELLFYAVKHCYIIWTLMKRMIDGHIGAVCWERTIFHKFIRVALFVELYSKQFGMDVLKDATYITHVVRDGDAKSLTKQADALLRRYAKSRLVVTSRIHCALPCVGMNVNTIFINHKSVDRNGTDTAGRTDGLIEFFNIVDFDGNKFIPRFSYLSSDGLIHCNTSLPKRWQWKSCANNLRKLANEFGRL